MSVPTDLFIDGQYRQPATGNRTALTNPATEQIFAEVAGADTKELDAAAQSAHTAWETQWRDLTPGKRADIAVWRTDGLELAGAVDLVAGLVLSAPHRVDRLYVAGEEVVREGRLARADEEEIARHHRAQARRFAP